MAWNTGDLREWLWDLFVSDESMKPAYCVRLYKFNEKETEYELVAEYNWKN